MFAALLQRQRPRRGRGFTLVEILCVVVILGIASAIIIPQIGSRDDLVVSAAARVVMADLIYAQNRAIATQKPHYVQFVGQQYTLSDATAMSPITHPITKNPYTVTLGAPNSGMENVTIVSANFAGQTILGFNELGSPFGFDAANPGGIPPELLSAGTIVIKCGKISLTISIEPYTGEATVK